LIPDLADGFSPNMIKLPIQHDLLILGQSKLLILPVWVMSGSGKAVRAGNDLVEGEGQCHALLRALHIDRTDQGMAAVEPFPS
jgi:hypothetical protein